MSGGSLDYVYRHVDEAIEKIGASDRPLHRAFASHLRKVSKALHDLEWVWSADKAHGDEDAAIRAVVTRDDEIAAAMERAEQAHRELSDALAAVRSTVS